MGKMNRDGNRMARVLALGTVIGTVLFGSTLSSSHLAFATEFSSTNSLKSITPNPIVEKKAEENLERGKAEEWQATQQRRVGLSDMRITRMIRQSLIRDGSLSPAAHNVTVITHKGEVTLRGSVLSAAEETMVVEKAKSIAGQTNVINRLYIQSE